MLITEPAGNSMKKRFSFLFGFAAVLAAAVLLVVCAKWLAGDDPTLFTSTIYTSEQGKLDASGWNAEVNSSLMLDGEWELYWGKMLKPEDFRSLAMPSPVIVDIPQPWTGYSIDGRPLPNEGFATYRLRILLPESLTRTRESIGLYPKSIASAYQLWVNGDLKGGNGLVGTDASSTTPRSYPKTIYFEPREGWNEIIIQVSNYSQRNAGIWQGVELGTADGIAWMRVSRVSAQVFIVGIFFVMALYYFFVYVNRRQEISAFLFGLLCFSVGIRTIVLGESTALFLLPGLPWEWGVKAEYISIAMTALCLILFVSREYPRESISWVPKAAGLVLGSFIIFFLITPARVYTYYLTPYIWGVLFPVLMYTMYIYILSAIRRRKGSMTTAIGFLFFTIFALNDMMFYTGLLPTNDLLSIGLLAFLLTQALNLSARFSRAIAEKEQLSEQLRENNRSLERTVAERTHSLQKSNARLQEANKKMEEFEHFRIRLLSNISHELSTPITSIKGFAKALRDGIITADAPKYANRIYERSLLLERMIHDLVELTKLETNQVRFHMQEVEVVPFLQELFLKYEWEIESKGIHCQIQLPEDVIGAGSFIKVDSIRIEQVLSNLISNAVRYTPEDGVIVLKLQIVRLSDGGSRAVVGVRDTGVGIDRDMHQHIFERFGQAKQQTAVHHNGSGLGLAICKEIIHYHHGEIRVVSEPGEGSEFSFELPIVQRGGALR
ncbi:sensor histidine kinase [Paenibacillus lemnae]|uniref:histidine kinase n=1 Tax=Paenibacillus lemnae TaxID=1330551 RepID=A0A848M7L8_PAELE|nr:sensor histidine kinase [Paenibacillus lemnae]NMO95554.1 histidine kinase [Paenibacillus lemnae]